MSRPCGTVPTMDTPPFGPDTVLIGSSKKAHRPGCQHNDDTMIRSGEHAGWGWVPQVSPEQWLRINQTNPLRATHGNTSRVAVKRCKHCSRS